MNILKNQSDLKNPNITSIKKGGFKNNFKRNTVTVRCQIYFKKPPLTSLRWTPKNLKKDSDTNPFTHLEESEADEWGVEGVFFRKLSKKLTPLEIKLEKLRFKFKPNSGLGKIEPLIKSHREKCTIMQVVENEREDVKILMPINGQQ